MRSFQPCLLALALAVTCPLSAAWAQPAGAEPALTLRTQPLVEVLALVKSSALYVLDGKSEDAQQTRHAFEAGWNAFVGEKGKQLLGVDTSRPIAACGFLLEDLNGMVVAIPVSDDKLFRDWLGNLGAQFEGQGDVFEIAGLGLPPGSKVRFAEKYAQFMLGKQLPAAGIDPAVVAKALARPATAPLVAEFIPARAAAMMGTRLREIQERTAADKEPRPGETWNAFTGRKQGEKWGLEIFRTLLEDMDSIVVSVEAPKGERVTTAMKCRPKAGTAAGKVAAAKSQSAFGPVAMPGQTLGVVTLHGPMCASLKEVLGTLAHIGFRSAATKNDDNAEPSEAVMGLYKLLAAHLGPAPLDFSLVGSATEKNVTPAYCLRVGLVDGAKLETALVALAGDAPADLKEALELDVAKVGAQRIHALKLPPPLADFYAEGAMRRFAQQKVFFAITPTAFMAVGGADGQATLAKALAAPRATEGVSQISYDIQIGNMLTFMAAIDESLEKLPAKFATVRQGYAGKGDRFNVTIAGGEQVVFQQDIDLAGAAMFVQFVGLQLEETFSRIANELDKK